MKKWMRRGAATVMMLATTESAVASDGCVRHEEMTALKAAAVQQQLMVAALSCRATSLYNRFVLSYRRELEDSDAALKAFFQRRPGGEAEYNAFKTRLANASSLSSIGHTRSYCKDAYAAFDAALSTDRRSLEEFVGGRPVDLAWSECNENPRLVARNEMHTDRWDRDVNWFERHGVPAVEPKEDDGPLAPQDHPLPPDSPAY